MEFITFEKAVVADAPEILNLQQQAYQEEAKIYNDYNIPPLRQTLAELQTDFAQQLFLKAVVPNPATSDEKTDQTEIIAGSVRAYIKEGTCYIGRLIVAPAYQNRGVGKQLMQEIEHNFRQASRFELFTGYKSERNLYLYKKLGYQVFKTQKIDENLSLVYLEKLNN